MKSVLTIGNFDGIHLGHRKLLESVISLAKEHKIPSAVITFSVHPTLVLNGDSSLQLLTPPSHKEELLRELGIDIVQSLVFTHEMANTSAEDFLAGYMIPQFDPHTIVMGYDSRFGHQRRGDLDFVRSQEAGFGYQTLYVPPLYNGNQIVSSTLIRSHLLAGRVHDANELLATPYRIYGSVVHGDKLGHDLGFPTANLLPEEPQQLIPASGVYLSQVNLRGERFFGLTNIGISPTVKNTNKKVVETYMLDFDKDIYGATIEVELLTRLRSELRFANVDELKNAMQDDLHQAKAMIGRIAR